MNACDVNYLHSAKQQKHTLRLDLIKIQPAYAERECILHHFIHGAKIWDTRYVIPFANRALPDLKCAYVNND